MAPSYDASHHAEVLSGSSISLTFLFWKPDNSRLFKLKPSLSPRCTHLAGALARGHRPWYPHIVKSRMVEISSRNMVSSLSTHSKNTLQLRNQSSIYSTLRLMPFPALLTSFQHFSSRNIRLLFIFCLAIFIALRA